MKTTTLLQTNLPARAGFLLIAFAIIFWISVIADQVFHSNWLIEHVITPVDKVSFLSPVLVIILPLIAFTWNMLYTGRLKIMTSGNDINCNISLKLVPLNIFIILFSIVNMGMITTYLFTENFILVSR